MQYYVGVDIAKYTHYASIISQDGEIIEEAFKFENNIEGFNLLLSKINKFNKNDILIGFESTAHYAENLSHFLLNLNYNLGLINPLQTSSLRKLNIRKAKNDKIDTFIICKCLMLGHYNPILKESLIYSALKTLTISRNSIIKSKTRYKIQLVSYIDKVFPELHSFFKSGIHINVSYALLKEFSLPKDIQKLHLTKLTNLLLKNSSGHYKKEDAIYLKKLATKSIGINDDNLALLISEKVRTIQFLEQQLNKIELKSKELVENLDSPIMSIPGISYVQAATILAYIGDINRFYSPKALVAFAGLDPVIYQSGNFQAKTTRMSKRGSKLLRYALVWSSWNVVRNSETFKDYYSKKVSSGLSHYAALGHVATKLIRVIFKLLKDNISFNLP